VAAQRNDTGLRASASVSVLAQCPTGLSRPPRSRIPGRGLLVVVADGAELCLEVLDPSGDLAELGGEG
jgi:hypothetical protein